jgi:hypothetical protein
VEAAQKSRIGLKKPVKYEDLLRFRAGQKAGVLVCEGGRIRTKSKRHEKQRER